MALDPIWKQQLTLVSYGNEFLSQKLDFNQWINHTIFDHHYFAFRDLDSQHLLAQHFQIWLEGLKQQGVHRISLHNSSVLLDEKNPNANVELLPYAHFIVSHHAKKKIAWICGKELAEWYTADQDYPAPEKQKISSRVETLWRYELNNSHAKRIESDLQQPNWDDIHLYTESELFKQPFADGLVQYNQDEQSNDGYEHQAHYNADQNPISKNLALLPDGYNAHYAHQTLIRLDALDKHLENKIKHPFNNNGDALTADQVMNLRHFRQKLEDLTAKFITKAANHYQTAHLTPIKVISPLDEPEKPISPKKIYQDTVSDGSNSKPKKSGKSGVFTLILMTVILCICAYYFGL